MATREDILTAIRSRRPPSRELPQIPDFHLRSRRPHRPVRRRPRTPRRHHHHPAARRPATWLTHTFPDAHRVYSTVPEAAGTITPAELTDWAAPADIDVTIVRTPLGIAETGSILVTEKELGINTIATLAQHLVVLLDPADLVDNVHTAYRHPSFQDAAYAVLLSGPSGSADIGGITVHPAQGVTTLTVVLSPHRQPGRRGSG